MKNGLWTLSYVVLWITVVVLAVAVAALLRQIGVLHARLAPLGTHFAGEGPELDSVAPAVGLDWNASPLTIALFTSSTCTICRELKPSIDAMKRQYRDLRFETLDADAQTATFSAFAVRSTPYVVTVDRNGIVRGRGVANSIEQIEQLISESLSPPAPPAPSTPSTPSTTSATSQGAIK
jgi:thiol-disulfide isomerase/thioredoxin